MNPVTLEELVEKVDEIPVFPQVIRQIIQLIEAPDSSAKDVERGIIRDQGLTTKILKLANSAYYGLSRNVRSVSEATVLLGFQAIKSMVLATSVGKVMDRELPGYALGKEALWRQSQICAITTRVVAKKCRYPKADQAYTAGLLRDIGKVVLDHYMRAQYETVVTQVYGSDRTFLEVERSVLGFDHGQVGAHIAEKWHLPEELVEAIATHHTPEQATINPKMTAMVHVADVMVMMMGLHLGIDGMAYNCSQHAMDLLGLDEAVLEEIMAEVADIIADEGIYLDVG